jgi:hypothetical protein
MTKIMYNYSRNKEETDLELEIEHALLEPKIERKCPICREEVYTVGRCKTCLTCGWSACEV